MKGSADPGERLKDDSVPSETPPSSQKRGAADTWAWMWSIAQKPIPMVEMNLPPISQNKKILHFLERVKKIKPLFYLMILAIDALSIYFIFLPYIYLYDIAKYGIVYLSNQEGESLAGRFWLLFVGVVWVSSRIGIYSAKKSPKIQKRVFFTVKLAVIILVIFKLCFVNYLSLM